MRILRPSLSLTARSNYSRAAYKQHGEVCHLSFLFPHFWLLLCLLHLADPAQGAKKVQMTGWTRRIETFLLDWCFYRMASPCLGEADSFTVGHLWFCFFPEPSLHRTPMAWPAHPPPAVFPWLWLGPLQKQSLLGSHVFPRLSSWAALQMSPVWLNPRNVP